MRSKPRLTALLLTYVIALAACSGDDGDATTTTAGDGDTVTSLGDTPTAATGDTTGTGGGGGDGNGDGGGTTTTVDLGAAVVPEFEIVSREESEDGDTVVIVLDPASYDRLTDIDIQNVATRLVEDFPPVSVAHVVDDDRVAELVLTPGQVDEEGEQLLEVHYLASLDDGRLTYHGRFESAGVVILGS
jgi:hypothetical protein